MKKSLKVLKVILIVVISLFVLVYGGVFLGHKVIFPIKTSNVPTIEPASDGTFLFGPIANAPKTLEEFVPVFAEQLRLYNKVAPSLWPNNAMVNQSAILEGLESGRFWYVSPDGQAKPLSKDEALSYGFQRMAYLNGFSAYDGGMYLAVTEENLPNYLEWEVYLFLGTYDSILFLSHEGFHMKEQSKWQAVEANANKGRDDHLNDIPARAKRDLLQRQLLKAVSQPGNTRLILEAVSTYENWKKQFPDDFNNAKYYDIIEGTAQYYEIISGLYIGYPDQVNSGNIDKAITLLATRDDVYVWHGVTTEGYIVGGFACFLLDRLEDDWKERLIASGDTPIEMLSRHFKDEILPPPQQLTQADIDAVVKDMKTVKSWNINDGKRRSFKWLYDMLF